VSDAVSTATPPFAPSELVVLFGDRFAPEAGLLAAKEEILTSAIKVNAEKLMTAAVATAVWAVHRSGAARLEMRTGKALFGLMKTQKLHIVRGTGASGFPAGSIEAHIAGAAHAEPEVQKLLEAYIGGETVDPSGLILGKIKRGMATRGLLDIVERTTMMVFTTADFALPEATRAAAAREPLDAVQSLLRDAEQREPMLFKEVQKDIDGARAMMTDNRD
jgi:hypothetical protein